MIKFLVNRPIAVLTSFLSLIILGMVSLQKIPTSLLPESPIPIISIECPAPGMDSRDIESLILKPLRAELSQITNLQSIESLSDNEIGKVVIKLNRKENLDYIVLEINEKLDEFYRSNSLNLPRPSIRKSSVTDIPIFYLNISSNKSSDFYSSEAIDLSLFVDNVVRRRIEQLEGVAMVDLSGLVTPEIRLKLDYEKITILNLKVEDIEVAINRNNIATKNLLVSENQFEYDLKIETGFDSLEDIKDTVIFIDNTPFTLSDIALVEVIPSLKKGLILDAGRESFSFGIIKRSDANIKTLKQDLQLLISSLKKDYTQLNINISQDQINFLDITINSLIQSLILGIIFAILITYLFLRSLKISILIGITIPVSLIISILFFYLAGISINIISLSGLLLGIGLMIDNSIIVIDNIIYYQRQGKKTVDACVIGVNDIYRPLISSVLTTSSVFIPLIFLSGLVGALFSDQAYAISISLIISLVVSFLLLPVLFKLLYKKDPIQKGKNPKNNTSKWILQIYELTLFTAFRNIKRLIIISIILFFLGGLSIKQINLAKLPVINSNELMVVINWSESISLDEGKERMRAVTKSLIQSENDFNNIIAFLGKQQFLLNDLNNSRETSLLYLNIDHPRNLEIVKKNISNFIILKYPLSSVSFEEPKSVFNISFSEEDFPLEAQIFYESNSESSTLVEINKLIKELNFKLKKHNQSVENPQLKNIVELIINDEKMAIYNIEYNDLTSALKSKVSSFSLSTLNDIQSVPIKYSNTKKDIKDILENTFVRAKDSTYFPLSVFITNNKKKDLKNISASLEGTYIPLKFDLKNDELESVKNIITTTTYNHDSLNVKFSGSLYSNKLLLKQLSTILFITILLLYLILSAQFESLLLPLLILIEIPIAIMGSFIFLYITKQSLNLMSMIGIVIMCGIIINDSILKIDCAKQLVNKGNSVIYSIIRAGQRRLMPILMTTLTTILAMCPLFFIGGLGSDLQSSLAISVIGGLIIGTASSLYLIPVLYYFFNSRKKLIL